LTPNATGEEAVCIMAGRPATFFKIAVRLPGFAERVMGSEATGAVNGASLSGPLHRPCHDVVGHRPFIGVKFDRDARRDRVV
jgi:hypothetical protein